MDLIGATPIVWAAEATDLHIARSQMGFTLAFHMVFAALGIGLPLLMLVAERRALSTGDPVWRELARRWSRAFAVLFAVGAVSGTVLSFELGLLWPNFMGTFGSVVALPFTLEGFAFFTEAIFLGIYLYGWDRLSATLLDYTRYDKIVEAMGGHGELVQRPEELRPALDRAAASGKPALVNVVIRQDREFKGGTYV